MEGTNNQYLASVCLVSWLGCISRRLREQSPTWRHGGLLNVGCRHHPMYRSMASVLMWRLAEGEPERGDSNAMYPSRTQELTGLKWPDMLPWLRSESRCGGANGKHR